MRQFLFHIPDELYERLRTRAFETRITMSEIVRESIAASLGVKTEPLVPGRPVATATKAEPDDTAKFMSEARRHQTPVVTE